MSDLNFVVLIIQLVIVAAVLAVSGLFVFAWWHEQKENSALVERSLKISETSQALEAERAKNEKLSLQLKDKELTISERNALRDFKRQRRPSDPANLVSHSLPSHPDILPD